MTTRRKFLQLLGAAGAMLALPFKGKAKTATPTPIRPMAFQTGTGLLFYRGEPTGRQGFYMGRQIFRDADGLCSEVGPEVLLVNLYETTWESVIPDQSRVARFVQCGKISNACDGDAVYALFCPPFDYDLHSMKQEVA